MRALTSARAAVFIIPLFILIQTSCAEWAIPDETIRALKPRGFKASIPDSPNVSRFTFHGNVNRPIDVREVGTITGKVLRPKDGRWTFEDPNLELKVGDVINYYAVVATNDDEYCSYAKIKGNFTIKALEDRLASDGPVPTECKPTVTKVRGGSACAGQTIFEENFDNFRYTRNEWQIEQYIPVYTPNFPFVSYQFLWVSDPPLSVSDGKLRIAPKLQQKLPGFTNDSIYTGTLNLFSGYFHSCTSSAEACMKQAWGADILPPIVSGKITTKGFAFTYGTVTVRAKLPQGDWIYPEILLEPFLQKYGTFHYSSGVLNIASARGNRELKSGTTDYSNKVLFGGPVMDLQCHDTLLNSKTLNDGLWGDDYHEYSLRWAPDRITLSVDGTEWARVEPTASGLRGRFPDTCTQLPRTLLAQGSRMAPFDDHFYITLGVGAGGITEFPDGVKTANDRPKPWSNRSRKALLNFWQDMDSWLTTWNQPQLLVDYVKVVAL